MSDSDLLAEFAGALTCRWPCCGPACGQVKVPIPRIFLLFSEYRTPVHFHCLGVCWCVGARVREQFGIPVTGVAKAPFRTATHIIPVLRGTSVRPLYVIATGIPRADAADLIRHMVGRHRLPDTLRRADTLARQGLPEPPRRS